MCERTILLTIAGRVHQHGPRPLGTMAVTVRCTEAWRSHPPWSGALPDWDENVVRTASVAIQLDDDRRWAPFRYEIPDATEALTVSWRYELVVSRAFATGPTSTQPSRRCSSRPPERRTTAAATSFGAREPAVMGF